MKYKTYLTVALLLSVLFPSTCLYSQQTKDLIGQWKVVKVDLSADAKKEEKEKIGLLNTIFSKVVFHFKADSSFRLDASDEGLAVKDGIWEYDETKKSCTVYERQYTGVRGKLMMINVKQINDKYLFLMGETPIILEVRKVLQSKAK